MTNQEILERAIQKAIDGGWKAPNEDWYVADDGDELNLYYLTHSDSKGKTYHLLRPYELIFSHDFPKALWGSRWDENNGCKVHNTIHSTDSMGDDYSDPDAYHLQQMVIADDPLKYLGENI